jgi:hypothetical protein
LAALFFITRSSASRGKTVMWMLITLVVTIAVFVGLAGFVSSPEAAYGLGGLGSLIGMVASVAVGLKPALKKAAVKTKALGKKTTGAKTPTALRARVRGKSQSVDTEAFAPEALRERSGGQSAWLSRVAG